MQRILHKCGGQCILSQELRVALIIQTSQGQINLIVGSPILTLPLKGTWRNTVCLPEHSFGAGTPPTMPPTPACEPGGTSVPSHWLV